MNKPAPSDYYQLLEKYEDAQNDIRWLQRAYANTAEELRALRQQLDAPQQKQGDV